MTNQRPSWDDYFMKIAMLVSERSTCVRHHVGAVIVRDKQLLTTGYNGAVKTARDCHQLGCLRNALNIPSGTRHEICRAVHAEQNAITQAANQGININHSTLYCTHSPCIICAKMIVNAGIKRVCAYVGYPDPTFQELFAECGVVFDLLPRPDASISILD